MLYAVLGNFVSALNRFIADRYSSNHSVSEYHVYEFFKVMFEFCSFVHSDYVILPTGAGLRNGNEGKEGRERLEVLCSTY